MAYAAWLMDDAPLPMLSIYVAHMCVRQKRIENDSGSLM